MVILEQKISRKALADIAAEGFGDIVKAVVDVDRQIIALDAELHSDLESLLLEDGSKQSSLWGINFYPELEGEDFIEFDSLINIRPRDNNRSRSVERPQIRKQIIAVSRNWIEMEDPNV
jgi:hypothetical protein